MSAVLLVGTTGFGMVALFAMHGAPDLALTQALVEMVTLVVFVLVLRRLPTKIAQRNRPVKRLLRASIGIAVGAVMAVVAVIALGARQAESIGTEWPRLAFEEAHGRNIVNTVLVDIRAWDTMGEIAVLVVVATGIASLLFVTGRAGPIPRLVGARQQRRGQNRRRVLVDPLAPGPEASSSRMSWLLAGRALAPDHRSVLLEVLVRLLFHPAILVSIYFLFVGHNAPGGGFAGGLLAGLALVARYLAGGRYELAEAIPIDAGKILGAGIALAAGCAVGSLFFGAETLSSAYFEADVIFFGAVSFGTSTIFDIGVYLVVVGLVLDILRSLGAEIDRQQEEANLSEESRDEFSESEVAR
jgi:multicomponent Na+:H+ antiporter subunit A